MCVSEGPNNSHCFSLTRGSLDHTHSVFVKLLRIVVFAVAWTPVPSEKIPVFSFRMLNQRSLWLISSVSCGRLPGGAILFGASQPKHRVLPKRLTKACERRW